MIIESINYKIFDILDIGDYSLLDSNSVKLIL